MEIWDEDSREEQEQGSFSTHLTDSLSNVVVVHKIQEIPLGQGLPGSEQPVPKLARLYAPPACLFVRGKKSISRRKKGGGGVLSHVLIGHKTSHSFQDEAVHRGFSPTRIRKVPHQGGKVETGLFRVKVLLKGRLTRLGLPINQQISTRKNIPAVDVNFGADVLVV